jgi:hypothetical protein
MINYERRREINQLVEACRQTDRTELEIEKTEVIAELLAELSGKSRLPDIAEPLE